MKEKQTILQKIQKNLIKKLEKNKSAREKKFVYLLICENNKMKQKLLLSLSILVFFWSIRLFWFFGVRKKRGKLQKTKGKIKTNLSGIH